MIMDEYLLVPRELWAMLKNGDRIKYKYISSPGEKSGTVKGKILLPSGEWSDTFLLSSGGKEKVKWQIKLSEIESIKIGINIKDYMMQNEVKKITAEINSKDVQLKNEIKKMITDINFNFETYTKRLENIEENIKTRQPLPPEVSKRK